VTAARAKSGPVPIAVIPIVAVEVHNMVAMIVAGASAAAVIAQIDLAAINSAAINSGVTRAVVVMIAGVPAHAP